MSKDDEIRKDQERQRIIKEKIQNAERNEELRRIADQKKLQEKLTNIKGKPRDQMPEEDD